MAETRFIAAPGGQLRGKIRVPGDKSVSHRSIMFGALAEGTTEVAGFLEGEDCLRTLQAFRDMGVQIEGPEHNRVLIHGVGLHGLKPPAGPVDVGNAGTSMRLLAGILAGQSFDSELVGDESLSRRPMRRVTEPLTLMGAKIETPPSGTPPLKIKGGNPLHGIGYALPMASAQVKSCLLLAGLYAKGVTSITEPAPTRDHTERMLQGFGYNVARVGSTVTLTGGGKLSACPVIVPGDISSAAFFMVGASIAPDSDLEIENVGMNPTRTGVIDILRLMGANIDVSNERIQGGEPVADLRVRYAPLKGISIPESLVPLAIDEFPAIFIAAACAEGQTVLTGAKELRAKESDRIQSMADGLAQLGINAKVQADGIVITGGEIGAADGIRTHHDHRIAMSFAMAALRAKGNVVIRHAEFVDTSFPGFVDLAAACGLAVRAEQFA